MKRLKSLTLLLFIFTVSVSLQAQEDIPEILSKKTVAFVQRDSTLYMDIYRLKGTEEDVQPVMLFVFGGGFIEGKRDDPFYYPYFTKLAENNMTVVAIDYRLGLIGKKVSLFDSSAAEYAINLAVEDLYTATGYLLEHYQELKIDPYCMMISGSSAGAITVLQADYYLNNQMSLSSILPETFRYQGVLAFAGSVYSLKGTPDYKVTPPAPTLFFHGDKDRVVTYNKLRLFKRGMFGSKALAGRFKKRGFSYLFYTKQNKDHSVAGSPMHDDLEKIMWFIEHFVYQRNNWQMNVCWKDLDAPVEQGGSMFNLINEQK